MERRELCSQEKTKEGVFTAPAERRTVTNGHRNYVSWLIKRA